MHQAAYLRDERGVIEIPLLLDPAQQLRARVDLGHFGIRGVLSRRGAWNYIRALRAGGRQGRIHGYDLRPGLVIADSNLDVVEIWRGDTWGDYPPIDEVLAVLER